MVSFASLKSSSTQQDIHLVDYGPVEIKTQIKALHALGRGYLVIDRSLPQGRLVFRLRN